MYAEVQSVEELTPDLVRVTLAGGTLGQFEGSKATDAYVNARFLPADSPVEVPFDPQDLEGVAAELRPRPRRFTIRRWDPDALELVIDFVVHGDVGYAGAWAQRASAGDRLQFEGPGGSYRPSPDVDWHLLAGDESAFGAIGASLESLAPNAIAEVFVLVEERGREVDFPSLGDVRVTWLYREDANDAEVLARAVAAAEFPPGRFDTFVHGEAEETRAVRRHLAVERNVDVDAASISPYWRRRHTDEDWRKVKRQWMAEQASDV